MRPGRAPSPLRAGGGEQRERERGGGLPERPPSPKKRKASYNIDKEFILKDDKVKRNTGAAGGPRACNKLLACRVLHCAGWTMAAAIYRGARLVPCVRCRHAGRHQPGAGPAGPAAL